MRERARACESVRESARECASVRECVRIHSSAGVRRVRIAVVREGARRWWSVVRCGVVCATRSGYGAHRVIVRALQYGAIRCSVFGVLRCDALFNTSCYVVRHCVHCVCYVYCVEL